MPPPIIYESIPLASASASASAAAVPGSKRRSPREHQVSTVVLPLRKKAKRPAASAPAGSAEQWCEAIVEFRKGRNLGMSPEDFLKSDKSPEVFNDASEAQVNLFVRRLDKPPAAGKLPALLKARAKEDTKKIRELCGLQIDQDPPYPPVSDEMEDKLMMDFDPELVVKVCGLEHSGGASAEEILEDLVKKVSLKPHIRDMTSQIEQKLIQNRTDEASELYQRVAAMYEGHQDCLAELQQKLVTYVDAEIIPILFPGTTE